MKSSAADTALSAVVGRQSFADAARHDGGKGFPPYDCFRAANCP
jgi:hypothetical protein